MYSGRSSDRTQAATREVNPSRKALAAAEATWTEHRQLQRDAALTEGEIHALLWPGEGENRHAHRVAAKASRRRPRHLPRYASTDSFRQMCVSLRRWWRCDGVPRLDVLKTYLARNRQIWRLHDEGDSNRQIARDLDMTEGDVRHHLRRGRSCLSELAEGIYWLADRVRNAIYTLTPRIVLGRLVQGRDYVVRCQQAGKPSRKPSKSYLRTPRSRAISMS